MHPKCIHLCVGLLGFQHQPQRRFFGICSFFVVVHGQSFFGGIETNEMSVRYTAFLRRCTPRGYDRSSFWRIALVRVCVVLQIDCCFFVFLLFLFVLFVLLVLWREC